MRPVGKHVFFCGTGVRGGNFPLGREWKDLPNTHKIQSPGTRTAQALLNYLSLSVLCVMSLTIGRLHAKRVACHYNDERPKTTFTGALNDNTVLLVLSAPHQQAQS